MNHMLNSIESYRESGRRAAIAMNQNDYARAQFERDWLTRALALESPEHRTVARNSYAQAYSEARKI